MIAPAKTAADPRRGAPRNGALSAYAPVIGRTSRRLIAQRRLPTKRRSRACRPSAGSEGAGAYGLILQQRAGFAGQVAAIDPQQLRGVVAAAFEPALGGELEAAVERLGQADAQRRPVAGRGLFRGEQQALAALHQRGAGG